MSGSLYGYSPWQAPRETPGQAMSSGFREAQEIDARAMRMDELRQMARMRELQEGRAAAQEGRTAQRFPIDLQTAEQALQAARQTYGFNEQRNPLTLEQMRLANRRTQQGITEAAAVQQAVGALSLPPLPGFTAGGSRPPSAPGVATPGGPSRGLIMPGETPATTPPATPPAAPPPGPQSSLEGRPAWLSPELPPGQRYERVGPMLASAGVSDYSGMPTGLTPGMLAPQQAPGVTENVTVSAEAPILPTGPGDIERMLQQRADESARMMLLDRMRSAGEAASARSVIIANAMRDVRALINTGMTPQAAIQETLNSTAYRGRVTPEQLAIFLDGAAPAAAPGTAATPATPAAGAGGMAPRAASVAETGMTEAQMREATAGRGDQEDTVGPTTAPIAADRAAAQQQAPSDPYMMEPLRVARDQRNIQQARAVLEQQFRVASARRDVATMQRLQEQAVALNQQAEYLNGMYAITRMRTGDLAPIAAAIYDESSGRMQIQPNQDGTVNIFMDGQVRNRNVSRQDLETQARLLYDTRYQQQVQAERQREAELALRRAQQNIDQMARVNAESVLEALKAEYRGNEIRPVRLPDGREIIMVIRPNGSILTAVSVSEIPATERGGRPRTVLQPVYMNQ